MIVKEFDSGIAINGTFPNDDVLTVIKNYCDNFSLIVADPPYGNVIKAHWDRRECDKKHANWMINWSKVLSDISLPGAALYVWGGYGRPQFRPFYRYIVDVEHGTSWRLANHITWKKKRAYGVKYNYLSTREECAYLVNGDIKKPRMFNIPLLEKERGYVGYNKAYPAKSKYFRRTSVWTDITEIMRGKVHETQKQLRVIEIPIEVHTNENDIVLDPFAGSGTTAVAALKLKRKFVIVEQDKTSYDTCIDRITNFQYRKTI